MKKMLSVLIMVILLAGCVCMAEAVEEKPAVVAETTVEAGGNEANTAVENKEAKEEPNTTEEKEDTVEDPGFGKTEDPLGWLRVALAAIGAFAIAFFYSRQQHMKNARKRR